MRRIGDYDEAIKLIVEVLRQRPTMLTAQVAGAETLAAQGEVERDGYMRSILGERARQARPQSDLGLGKTGQQNAGQSEVRRDVLSCPVENRRSALPLRHSRTRTPQTAPKSSIAAKNDLWVTFRLYPSLGGPQSLRQIRSTAQANPTTTPPAARRFARIQRARSRRRKRTRPESQVGLAAFAAQRASQAIDPLRRPTRKDRQ